MSAGQAELRPPPRYDVRAARAVSARAQLPRVVAALARHTCSRQSTSLSDASL